MDTMTTDQPVRDPKEIINSWDVIVPTKILNQWEIGGCKNKTKLFMFLRDNEMNIQELNYFIRLTPARLETEDYETYRKRRIFAKYLTKYRVEARSVIMYKVIKQAQEKIEKEQALFNQSIEEDKTQII